MRCLECGETFKEPAGRDEFDGYDHAFGVRQAVYVTVELCPHCESTKIQEFIACTTCEKEPALTDDDVCAGCLANELQAEIEFHLDNEQEPDFWRAA
jgi:superfamily II helicase